MSCGFRASIAGLGLVLLVGCGGDDGGDAGSDTAGEQGGTSNASATATTPDSGSDESDDTEGADTSNTTGPVAEGWESAYDDGGVVIGCEQSLAAMQEAGAPSVTIGDATLVVGYEQIGDNQNPIVARFDGDAQAFCVRHETEGPDGRALGLTWDGGEVAYVVYTIVGGGSSLEGQGGWIGSYAPGAISGGGPKVSYLGRVQAGDGGLASGTFIIAVKSDNTVNSHSPAGPPAVDPDGNVRFAGASAHKPIDEGLVSMDCTDYPFDSTYVFSPDLSAMVCAQCTNCTSQVPCP